MSQMVEFLGNLRCVPRSLILADRRSQTEEWQRLFSKVGEGLVLGDHFRGNYLLPDLLVVHLFHELDVALLEFLQKSLDQPAAKRHRSNL